VCDESWPWHHRGRFQGFGGGEWSWIARVGGCQLWRQAWIGLVAERLVNVATTPETNKRREVQRRGKNAAELRSWVAEVNDRSD